jgi:DNA-binding NtrC family response regulator
MAPAPTYVLKVLDDLDSTVRRHSLEPGEHLLGSAPDCDVQLKARGVSRHHARFEVLADGGLVVTDLGSRNGTFVDGRKIERMAVIDYAAVVLGPVHIVVHADEKGLGRIAVAAAVAQAAAEDAGRVPGDADGSTQGLGLAEGLARDLRALIADARDADVETSSRSWLRRLQTSLPAARATLLRAGAAGPAIVAASGAGGSELEEASFAAAGFELVVAAADARRLRSSRPLFEMALEVVAVLAERGRGPAAAGQRPPDSGRLAVDAGASSEEPPPPGVSNAEMSAIYRRCGKIARGEIPLLILGESGTGKEVLARWFHDRSRRAGGPFVAVNCAALPHELLEAELFGIERGVATGVEARPGLLEQASGGTLFLDEIGDMPLEIQAKVLRVLESPRLVRVGGRQPIEVDVRFVAATHQELEGLMTEKRFRRDLYFRLAAFTVSLPPLRERREDVALLAGHFFQRELAQTGAASPGMTRGALAALIAADWPGNVRQLKNEIARAVLLLADGEPLDLHHLSASVAGDDLTRQDLPLALGEAVTRAERQAFQTALALSEGDPGRAQEILGVSRTTYYRKLKELRLDEQTSGG